MAGLPAAAGKQGAGHDDAEGKGAVGCCMVGFSLFGGALSPGPLARRDTHVGIATATVLQVRRAHRAAYVTNLLRRKPKSQAGDAAAPGDTHLPGSHSFGGASSGAASSCGGDEAELELGGDDVVLTQQQEAEFELELQRLFEAAASAGGGLLDPVGHSAGSIAAAAVRLGVTLPAPQQEPSSSSSSSSEEEEEAGVQAAQWKVLSTPKAGPWVRRGERL
jgi:hypothetical protein